MNAIDSEKQRDGESLMTIRQMCDRFGVTPRTLRFYEAKELLAPQRIGQMRFFTRRDQARMKLIQRGKRFGFSLEEIRQLLELYRRDGGALLQLRRSYELAQQRLAALERERAELDATIDDLKQQLAWGARMLGEVERNEQATTR